MFTLVLWVLFLLSVYREPRSLLNPPLFIVTLFSTYFWVGGLVQDENFPVLPQIAFIGTFILAPFIALFIGIFLIYNGVIVIRKEGKSLANCLSLLLGIAIIAFFIITFIYLVNANSVLKNHTFSSYFFISFAVIVFSYFIFGMLFLGFFFYSIFYQHLPKRNNYDFIIIHGAGLINGREISPLLQGRIDTALKAYYKSNNPDIKIIASGGTGEDEKISEAQAIAKYLKTHSVPSSKILLEDESTNTYENLFFSKEIAEKLVANPKYLFVTSDYHVFRTSYYAKKIGMRGGGVGSKTAKYYFPTAFIREYIAIVIKMRWVFVVLYALLALALFLATR